MSKKNAWNLNWSITEEEVLLYAGGCGSSVRQLAGSC